MLIHANRIAEAAAASSAKSYPTFYQGDVRTVNLGQKFNAVLMMFAVLSYQLTNEDVLAALRTAQRQLHSGGLFICDVWYGPAVLSVRPSDRVKVIKTPAGKIVRTASGVLDSYHHTVDVHYYACEIVGDKIVRESKARHQIRYFSPLELEMFIDTAELELICIRSFDDLELLPDTGTWNALVLSRAH